MIELGYMLGYQWISVSDRLPEPFVSVLCQIPGEKPFPTVREGFLTNKGVWHVAMFDREQDEVTHWLPMPKPPKEGLDKHGGIAGEDWSNNTRELWEDPYA